jgi:hypothetical protein
LSTSPVTFQTPSGWYGRTGGPPLQLTTRPRTGIVADHLRFESEAGPRVPLIAVVLRRSSGVTFDDCRYVADVTISRWIAFMDQPRP